MDNFKKCQAFYGKFIETREEVLYEELLDYVAYRNKSCQPAEKKLEQIATDSIVMHVHGWHVDDNANTVCQ